MKVGDFMSRNSFRRVAMNEYNPDYQQAITRQQSLYKRQNDLRSEFSRDYNRIIFSLGYRRLKHKTQVFFAVEDDHVCTRIEHVNLVDSISYTIADYLGLNTELTRAIAVGHDLGHAPFGHGGEKIINELCKKYHLPSFWHEHNSLYFVDQIETLEDDDHIRHNLNLTYAVRDGIVSHCGEMQQKAIRKRKEAIDLNDYQHPGMYDPYTWEACVVKMSDKIAYLARDIEDALRLHILDENKIEKLKLKINEISSFQFNAINNGSIVNYFILDVCHHSSVEKGICLSDEAFMVMKEIMKFNYQNIYLIDRVKIHSNYVQLILNSIFDFLYKYKKTAEERQMNVLEALNIDKDTYPLTITGYVHWLEKYSRMNDFQRADVYQNHLIYDFCHDNQAMARSIIDYLSGMSDVYILKIFNEFLSFS